MNSRLSPIDSNVPRHERPLPGGKSRFLSRLLAFLILLSLHNNGAAAQTDLLVYGHGTGYIYRYNGDTGVFINRLNRPNGAGDVFGMDLSSEGSLYAVHSGGDTLYRVDPTTGDALETVASGGLLVHPLRVKFGPDGLLYITNRDSDSVARCDVQDGTLETFVPSGSGGLDGPRDLKFGPDGNLYVASENTDSVLRFDGTTGAFVDEFVQAGSGGLDNPRGLHFGRDCNLYVCSSVTSEVLRYDGTTGSSLGVAIASSEGGFSGSIWIGDGPDGNLYVCSSNTSEVLRFNPSGRPFIDAFVTSGSGGLSTPAGLLFVTPGPPPPTEPCGSSGVEDWALFD